MRCKEQTITFYPDIHSEKTMTEVFPETRLAFETSGSTAVATAAANFAIEDGKSYIVEFDDVLHEIVAASGALTNDLFRVTVADGVMTVSIEQAGSHTVRVITCTTHVCKMPKEYLPEGGGGGGADGRGLKVIEAATIEELYNKILALDNPVLFKVKTDGYVKLTGGALPGVDHESGTDMYDIRVDTYGGVSCLVFNYVSASASYEFFWEKEFKEGTYSGKPGEWFPLDFSQVTKFTVYYF